MLISVPFQSVDKALANVLRGASERQSHFSVSPSLFESSLQDSSCLDGHELQFLSPCPHDTVEIALWLLFCAEISVGLLSLTRHQAHNQ